MPARATMWIVAVVVVALGLGGCSATTKVSGQAWTRHTIDNSSLGADGVRAADVDGDGGVDLVAAWEQGGVTRIYLDRTDRSGPAWEAVTVGPTPDVEDAVFFDADGDGATDVVSCAEGDARRIAIHWAPGDPRLYTDARAWTTETLYADGSQWMFAVPADVDGRFGPDLVVGGKGPGASVGWLEAPERPRDAKAWRFRPVGAVGWTMSLAVDDMDGDGDLDIVVSDRYGTLAGLRWLENPGPGAEGPWPNRWIGLRGREVMFVELCDLDGDGVKEAVAPHYARGDWRLDVLRAEPGGAWREYRVPYPSGAGRPKAVAVGDLDLDGRLDVVLTSEQAYDGRRGVVWLRARTSPFEPGWDAFDVSGPEGTKFDRALLLDVDRDGDLDVVTTEERDNAAGGEAGLGVVWFENSLKG